ncbi:uroporphyrinogen-III synthase [Massilia sp. BSC265]|uniref:uroporphyrinogen-III synthase n=1 Tax=Massilia sp. BSC265 TaxID=1549812 RepID=UPI0004E883B1|nr:uroporphyrinogen-III synthase [Massilia sp. BSC265]KFI06477.1 uroporphyrinogen III synthase [Massilia sp. BSC265]
MTERAVVITRPRAQAEPLAQAVRARGRRAVVLPLLEIAPLDDTSLLRAALAELPSYALVAFVSPNAIDAAFQHLDGWPASVPIGVVGEGSRAALARHGITGDNATIHCPPDAASSDSEHLLASLDLSAFAGRRVLIVRGESGRELMADTLRAAGAQVDTVAAYRRSVPPLTEALAVELGALLAQPNDWIITSSEALRGLAGLVRQLDPDTGIDRLRVQHLIVPHARIAETARSLRCDRITLTGSGDARLVAALFAAIQSQE